MFQFNSHLQKQAAGCIWPMGRKTAVDIPRPQLESQLNNFIEMRILLGLVIDMGILIWKNSPLKP